MRCTMTKDEMLQKFDLCSLMRYTCSAYDKGVIREHSSELLKYLEGMDGFYKKKMPENLDSYLNF